MSLPILLAAATFTLQPLLTEQRILVGEPVRLVLTWSAQLPVEVFPDALGVTIDDGSGPRVYREETIQSGDTTITTFNLSPGREQYSELTLFFGRFGSTPQGPPLLAFPRAGRYSVRVQYSDHTGLRAESSPALFVVEEPSGDEAEVLGRAEAFRWELKWGGPSAEALLSQYPESRYLRLAKMAAFRAREGRLLDMRDPTTNQSLRLTMSKQEFGTFARQQLKVIADDLLAERDWGALEEARLALAADYSRRGGDAATADSIEMQILERFPRSLAAEGIRSRADAVPPTMTLTAAPSKLVPASQRFVSVTVSAAVSDNQDRAPRVALESVTCSEEPGRACAFQPFVAGAAYGTDDRAFELLAARTSPSRATVYTITYSATDAAGNRATATVTVTVPPDQGK